MDPVRVKALEAIYAAALDPRLWENALAAMAATRAGLRTHMLHADSTQTLAQRSVVSGYAPEFLESWDAHYEALNVWGPAMLAGTVGRPIHSRNMCDQEAMRRTEFYADWVRPQEDLVGGGAVVLTRTATQLTILGGNMPARVAEHHDDIWQRDLLLFGPAVRMAIQTNAALLGLELEVLLARRGVAEAPGRAVLLLDQRGALLHAGGTAEAELAHGRALMLGPGGRLVLRDPPADAALRRLLAAKGAPVEMRLAGSGELRMFRLTEETAAGLRLPPVGPGRRPAVVVLLTPDSRSGPSAADRVAAALGLTRTEAEVAGLLADGLTPEEIAAGRQVSAHTVRNQIKAAMQKTAARRQSDLVRLILTLRG